MLTTSQVARRLNISASYVRDLTLRHGIDASHRTAGGQRRFTQEDVSRLASVLAQKPIAQRVSEGLGLGRVELIELASELYDQLIDGEADGAPDPLDMRRLRRFIANIDDLEAQTLRTWATGQIQSDRDEYWLQQLRLRLHDLVHDHGADSRFIDLIIELDDLGLVDLIMEQKFGEQSFAAVRQSGNGEAGFLETSRVHRGHISALREIAQCVLDVRWAKARAEAFLMMLDWR